MRALVTGGRGFAGSWLAKVLLSSGAEVTSLDREGASPSGLELQGIEGDADKLELERLRDLFKGDHSAKQIIFLHDLYGLLEKVIDRCRDAGNIIVQVALKYA